MREWRDIHSQLVTVVAEHKWRVNTKPASYEELHMSMLAGLLGNIGWKIETEAATGGREEKGQRGEYLGARGIKFFAHPGAHLAKKPGRWIVAAELVETTRLFGRGLANIEPQWLEKVAGHLLKKQLLDPHWEKKAAEVVALERATLYGLVVYSGRKVNFGRVDMVAAREIFIREALVANNWETKLPFLAANEKLIAQVEELEHKSRRQDVLVDDELIYAFYDQQLPADVCSGYSFENWYREEIKRQPKLLDADPRRADAARGRRHHHPVLPQNHPPGRRGLPDHLPARTRRRQRRHDRDRAAVCAEPGQRRALRVAGARHAERQNPGAAEIPAPAAALAPRAAARKRRPHGGGAERARSLRRDRFGRSAAQKSPRRDAGGRAARRLQAGHAEPAPVHELPRGGRAWSPTRHRSQPGRAQSRAGREGAGGVSGAGRVEAFGVERGSNCPCKATNSQNKGSNQPLAGVSIASAATKTVVNSDKSASNPAGQRYTAWTFGELPELMEINKGGQTLIGFPALIDLQDAVSIEVFDEPDVAAAKHQAGLRRLFALHIKDALKYLEKNIPDLTKMAAAYMLVGRNADNTGGGTVEELREQIIAKALDRAFLLDPLPTNAAEFTKRLEEGRGRLTLISSEIARLVAIILQEYATAARKLKDTKNAPEATADVAAQLARLMPKRFIAANPLHPTPPLRPLPQSHHRPPRQIPSRPRPRRRQTRRTAPVRAKLLALGRRAQRRSR